MINLLKVIPTIISDYDIKIFTLIINTLLLREQYPLFLKEQQPDMYPWKVREALL